MIIAIPPNSAWVARIQSLDDAMYVTDLDGPVDYAIATSGEIAPPEWLTMCIARGIPILSCDPLEVPYIPIPIVTVDRSSFGKIVGRLKQRPHTQTVAGKAHAEVQRAKIGDRERLQRKVAAEHAIRNG